MKRSPLHPGAAAAAKKQLPLRIGQMFLLMIAAAGPVCGQMVAPADKQLDPAWVESLSQRGHALDAKIRGSKEADTLQYIGMPVGGIGCGTLYLGGDGRLWVWDIFNQFSSGVIDQHCQLSPQLAEFSGARAINARQGANYVNPFTPDTRPTPFSQGFGIRVNGQFQRFQEKDWAEVEFEGDWPVGKVKYRDPASPVEVTLRGFSPFIPLNLDDSSLPLTYMEFTVRNTSSKTVTADLSGWLENAVGIKTRKKHALEMKTKRTVHGALSLIQHSASHGNEMDAKTSRPDIVFADFEEPGYGQWVVKGEAFGTEPLHKENAAAYMGSLNIQGSRCVNSHASAEGGSIREKDAKEGSLTSPTFTIDRKGIQFLIGGGNHKGKTCLNLLVDGEVVRSATGKRSNKMEPASFNVAQYIGRQAQLEIVDHVSEAAWGNIGVDHIVFSDELQEAPLNFKEAGDYGTMALGVMGAKATEIVQDGAPGWNRSITLQPGEETKVVFLLAWHFPNIMELPAFPDEQHEYAARFEDAGAVASYAADHYQRLAGTTHLWVETWYDSTLPNWLMDRTVLTVNALQTANSYIFEDGQFWAWEGVGACPGTCTHVWQYAQGIARLFPSLERNLREVTDYGYAQTENGGIRFRGTYPQHPAVDGQAGIILRTYREHLMSPDDAFLRRVWPDTKRAMQYLIHEDGNADGIMEGAQHNTLDAAWYGPVAWLSGHYQAALRASEEMARLVGDSAFADEVEAIYLRGRVHLVERLFNGEYFINQPDPTKPHTINSGTGCLIDQVFGQSWAFQVGLGRTLPEEETRSALNALWKYNFTPDVGLYRAQKLPGRWYALPGESGMLMCTFPDPEWDFRKASGGKGFAQYFNECMSGFEYQVASHMVYEGTPGLIEKGLAVTRAIHDRYSPEKRNPYNEVECSDHYGRAAASYGVFLAACGFEYDGPEKRIGFAPRVSPEYFKAPFTAAEGWGSYSQKQTGTSMQASIVVNHGQLGLRTLVLKMPNGAEPKKAQVLVDGKAVSCKLSNESGQAVVRLKRDLLLSEGQTLSVSL